MASLPRDSSERLSIGEKDLPMLGHSFSSDGDGIARRSVSLTAGGAQINEISGVVDKHELGIVDSRRFQPTCTYPIAPHPPARWAKAMASLNKCRCWHECSSDGRAAKKDV